MKVETSSTAAFFDMELVLDPTATARTGKLYDAYKHFCEESGFSRVSIVKFPKLLADLLTDEKLPFTRHQGAQAYFEGVRLRENGDAHPTHSETLVGFEGVGKAVAGSLEEVSEGVELLPDMHLRELREFDTKVLGKSEKEENYLPDEEESDRESDREVELPPSTPSTPSNVVPVPNTTPLPTPSQVPPVTPPTPSKHPRIFEVGDRVVVKDVSGRYEGVRGIFTEIRSYSYRTGLLVKFDKPVSFCEQFEFIAGDLMYLPEKQ